MNNSLSLLQVYSQVEGNIVSDMDGEKVMLSIQNGKYYNLGEIGGEIWDQIKQPKGMEEIVEYLQTQYDVSKEECTEQVTAFLEQLLAEGLIKIENA
ncbi:lasso peptide biosynthesis PqqD family chaperone [Oceanobacillus piezotolerans]|uniref:Lasso peptide biosynthesis PqqD family chaperone n=1 Tax=Oceanobacillus piezotolerans TaxID=2448030 RepID=A0A498D907_9BACI|nr:lasso peptide biosynthesis PqqD family chaperone [Oceanobacillus piezotolerans]RLL42776.1 lasso peptide biosynthesis PqqD family chaperone [Oceanobacillus piezotolerans]